MSKFDGLGYLERHDYWTHYETDCNQKKVTPVVVVVVVAVVVAIVVVVVVVLAVLAVPAVPSVPSALVVLMVYGCTRSTSNIDRFIDKPHTH